MISVSILTATYNSPSKLEGVSRSDEGVCVPDVETFHETSPYHGVSDYGVSKSICGERIEKV